MVAFITIYEANTTVVGAAIDRLSQKIRWLTSRVPSGEISVGSTQRVGDAELDRIVGVQCEVIIWADDAEELEMLFWLNH